MTKRTPGRSSPARARGAASEDGERTSVGALTEEVPEGSLVAALWKEFKTSASPSVRERLSHDVSVDPGELFDHVYARPTAALKRQRAALLAELADAEPGEGGR